MSCQNSYSTNKYGSNSTKIMQFGGVITKNACFCCFLPFRQVRQIGKHCLPCLAAHCHIGSIAVFVDDTQYQTPTPQVAVLAYPPLAPWSVLRPQSSSSSSLLPVPANDTNGPRRESL